MSTTAELTEQQRALQWVVGSDTGISSKTIWAVMLGAVQGEARWPTYGTPADPDDFGRCYRLLELIPEWRGRLHEVAERFPDWAPLVENWEELEELFRPVTGTPGIRWNLDASKKMYARMRELRA